MKKLAFLICLVSLLFAACDKPNVDPEGPNLIFTINFDPDQERLDNLGNVAVLPAGHAAQDPKFNSISAHYVELIPNKFTALGRGEVLYKSEETRKGGDKAIDFAELIQLAEGDTFITVSLSDLPTGDYEYLRVSLAYQNYDIKFQTSGFGFPEMTGTIASFIGYNNYITEYQIYQENDQVNGNQSQGYWAFEVHDPNNLFPPTVDKVYRGAAPATTVVNPIASTSPIPAGSCLVTGAFPNKLTITGEETEDIVVEISLSTNNSFEWVDNDSNGKFDPVNAEVVVDMGVRGLIPRVK